MKNVDLELPRGDTGRWNLTFSPTNSLSGTPKIWFTAKRSHTDLDADAVISITSGTGGGITINAGTDTAVLVIPASATSALVTPSPPTPLALYYDIQLLQTDGTVTTVLYGSLRITGDVTRAVT